ncbi:tRNA lysidine(34) synthetase TilS [Phyllobacterium phragmitis]|uniref:tRNA(Ile)-lysidine synthase n=1 Tax=Phyllobacterium phragmitis TaxID=2670329 RepID=A0A2S9ITW2_9HYPH|nr:tRNA lysidine(34) synthetase TilS [Phyllobacterium phragmitis]PRD43966.1 tRNA lysidine(34) synthetase TilS [Phyllobacterium phragmitis]
MSVPRIAADRFPPDDFSPVDPARIFAPIDFSNERTVMAAVSGGGDSLALLFLLKDYLSGMGDPPQLIAATVDHGLRPESRDEAAAVAKLCLSHGIAHRILCWEGEKPIAGIPAAARDARYRLLTEAARDASARFVFTGHTREDQIETFLMRKARGGERGLAGMANLTLLNGHGLNGHGLDGHVWLLRPLLGTRRGDLRAFLLERQIDWFDDPTNENMAFERPRIRSRSGEVEAGAALEEIAARTAARKAQSRAAAAFLSGESDKVHVEPGEVAVVDAGWLADAGQDVAALSLGVLVAIIGGRRFLPGEAERERLASHLAAKGGGSARLGLGGCIIQFGTKRHRIWREARGLPELVLACGESAAWDGRYRIANNIPGGESVRIAPPSAAEFDTFCTDRGIERGTFYRAAALTGPGVCVGGEMVDIPSLTGDRFLPAGLTVTRYIALFDKVLPGHDLVLANAAAHLFARGPYPEPPRSPNML